MRAAGTLVVMLVLGLTMLLILRPQAQLSAEPAWGAGCLSCHSALVEGLLAIAGEDDLLPNAAVHIVEDLLWQQVIQGEDEPQWGLSTRAGKGRLTNEDIPGSLLVLSSQL